MQFLTLAKSVRERRNPELDEWEPPARLMSLDPGETTGWAFFEGGDLADSGETGPDDTMIETHDLIYDLEPDMLVIEDYKIYGWKANTHQWSSLFTPRLIGAIELTCILYDIDIHKQMAQEAKGFCTNKKLKQWNYYKTGKPHVRDAIRHGCYWLVFG